MNQLKLTERKKRIWRDLIHPLAEIAIQAARVEDLKKKDAIEVGTEKIID